MNCPGCNTLLGSGARFCGSCGLSLTAGAGATAQPARAVQAPANMIGREIAGRYRIRALLGAGGMGAVYRAEQISLKRTVALKLLKDELCEEPGIVRRFNAEAELAAKLNHPNTVTLFDFGQETDGTLFIAMEFVQGRSLRGVIKQGPVAPKRAVHICEQAAASLADAHRFGIVHRDLKPDNVMLSERGKKIDVVTVLDFGIAKLRDRDDTEVGPVTQAGDLLGTPQYMAPEQIRGEAVDGRTDVYAMGVMLYEMLTGRVPFSGSTVMAILSKQLTDVPRPPSQVNRSVQVEPDLEALIMASLQKDPAARPVSMEAVGDKLAELSSRMVDAPAPRKPIMSPSLIMGPTVAQSSTPIRPPGVPFTPDSFPHAMPQPPPTAVEHVTPPPATALAGPMVAGPMMATAAAGAPKSSVGWIVGGLVAVGLGAAGLVFALQNNGGADKTAASVSAADTGTSTDEKNVDRNKDVDTKEPAKKRSPAKFDLSSLSGITHTSALGWKLRLPPSYTIRGRQDGGLYAVGSHSGQNAAVVIAVAAEQQDWTKQKIEAVAQKTAASANALASLRRDWLTIQGASRYVGTYVTPAAQQYTFAIFVDGQRAYIVAFTTMEHVFKSADSLVKEIIDKRFQLP